MRCGTSPRYIINNLDDNENHQRVDKKLLLLSSITKRGNFCLKKIILIDNYTKNKLSFSHGYLQG